MSHNKRTAVFLHLSTNTNLNPRFLFQVNLAFNTFLEISVKSSKESSSFVWTSGVEESQRLMIKDVFFILCIRHARTHFWSDWQILASWMSSWFYSPLFLFWNQKTNTVLCKRNTVSHDCNCKCIFLYFFSSIRDILLCTSCVSF